MRQDTAMFSVLLSVQRPAVCSVLKKNGENAYIFWILGLELNGTSLMKLFRYLRLKQYYRGCG
jgi:hypothetical protein